MATILLVEADKLFRWWLRDALSRAGYRVIEAHNCRTASERAGREVDLAILDSRLPDGSAYTLLALLRQRAKCFPAIVLTAFPTDEGRFRAATCGAVDYLERPVEARELLPAVQTALGSSTRLRTTRAAGRVGAPGFGPQIR